MKYKLVIFDFDGTLADSFECTLKAFNTVALRHNLKRLDRHELEALRHLDARAILSHLGIPLWKLPAIARHLRAAVGRTIAEIKPFPGIHETLACLSERGVRLAMATSNSLNNVEHVLGTQHLALFHHLECGTSLFGKAARLRRILGHSRIAPPEAILIGDEIRDAQAAARTGIAFGAVTWGYTHGGALRDHGPQETFAAVPELVTRLP
jgi:phosphoglycolate phosphatase